MQNKIKAIIAPSILSCDFSILAEECLKLISAGADWLHVDVMDGHFVPNLSLGPPVIQCLNQRINQSKIGVDKIFLDCHCMVSEPDKWIRELSRAGADLMTIHYESNILNIEETSKNIRMNGMLAGLAIKPDTNLNDNIFDLLDRNLFDMVLVMTVEPGFGGQKFMTDMMRKVTQLRKRYHYLNIQVDGGITSDNIQIVADAGANVIVSGTGSINKKINLNQLLNKLIQVYKSLNQQATIQQMREIVNQVIQ